MKAAGPMVSDALMAPATSARMDIGRYEIILSDASGSLVGPGIMSERRIADQWDGPQNIERRRDEKMRG